MEVSSGALHITPWELELWKPAKENANAKAIVIAVIQRSLFDPEVLHLQPTTTEL